MSPMTVRAALEQGKSLLFYVETPLLDATVLLSEALGVSKERLLASLPDPLQEEPYRRYRGFLDRRLAGYPVSYIRGRKEFYSLEFLVDERVLVPRPETETLVEEALRLLASPAGSEARRVPRPRVMRAKRVHDACTGSGCVAIALKHTRPELEVSASDLSRDALAVARLNARRVLVGRGSGGLRLYRSNLLARVRGRFDLIAANPPYLTDHEVENMQKVGWPEPAGALRGGPDGTDLLRRLIRQAPRHLARGGQLLLEAAPPQMESLRVELAAVGFTDVAVLADLSGRQRVIRGRWEGRMRTPGETRRGQ
jgi:release factor glutamine methyltransferase